MNTNAMNCLKHGDSFLTENPSTDFAGYRLMLHDSGIVAQAYVMYEGRKGRLKSTNVKFHWKENSGYGHQEENVENYKTVGVKFYQEKRQLEFFINEKSLGVAYSDIRAGSYRLFVDVEGGPARISILDH